MTEDIRDAAREPVSRADRNDKQVLDDSPTASPSGTSETVEAFAAETARADELGAALSAPGAAEGARAPEGPEAPEAPDYKDKWLRTEAELQNFRRRAQRDREDGVRAAEDRILLDLIELLDDVERALAAVTPEQAADPWTQGVTLTAQRMRDALARRGVTTIVTHGQPFDPAFHDALLEVPAPEGVAPGCVAQEVLKGYRRGDRALRAARVVVARADH